MFVHYYASLNSTHRMQMAFLFSMKFPNNLPFKVSGYTLIKPVDGEP